MSDLQELYRRLNRLILLLEKVVELHTVAAEKPACGCCESFGPDKEYLMKLPAEVQHD